MKADVYIRLDLDYVLASLNKKQLTELAKDILDCISEKQVSEIYEECKKLLESKKPTEAQQPMDQLWKL